MLFGIVGTTVYITVNLCVYVCWSYRTFVEFSSRVVGFIRLRVGSHI